jgi:HrpA-like RNA helicase
MFNFKISEILISKNPFNFPKIELSHDSKILLTSMNELIIENYPFSTTPPTNSYSSSRNVSSDQLNVLSQNQSLNQSFVIKAPPNGLNVNILDSLPISKHRQDILNLYECNKLLVIEGDSGCGKSTKIPQFILDHCSTNNIPSRILVITPNRVCAVSAAEKVSFEREESLGTTCGYQIKLESKISASSNLIYTSSEYVLSKLIQESAEYFKNFTTIILDEFQERNVLTDFLMLCIRELCSKETLKFLILTCSESERIANYFNDCAIYKIKNDDKLEKNKISEFFMDDILKMNSYEEKLTNHTCEQFDNEDLYDTPDKSNSYYCVPIDISLISKLVNHLHLNSEDSSTILIFLPTYNEIILLANKLFETLDSNCEIVSLHNQMQSSDVSKVYSTFPCNERKIVLTTKIAENSLTVNNVKYVIDTGTEYIETHDAKTRCSTAKIDWISKTSAIQRKLRITSSKNGIIFRFYSRDDLNKFIGNDNFNQERYELKDSDITKICLLTKIITKSDSIEDFLFKIFPPPPSCEKFHYSISLLQQIGALNVDESFTQLGKILATIPLKVQHAKMILYGIFFKCIDPILTIVSILSLPSPFNEPTNSDDRAKIEEIKQQLSDGSFSDIFVLLKLFQNWNEYKSSKTFDCIFCEKNFVGPGTLELISLFRVRLVGHLRSLKIIQSVGSISLLNENSNSWSIIKACITAGSFPNVMVFSDDQFSDKEFRIQQSSVLNNVDLKTISSNFLVYESLEKISNDILKTNFKDMKTCTIVSNFCVALICGNELTYDSTNSQCIIKIDNSLQFNGTIETAKALEYLRERLNNLFRKFLCNVEKFTMTEQESIVHEGIVTILKIEDQEIGMKSEYKGIGSRPRIVTRDCIDTSMNSSTSVQNLTSMTSNCSSK